MPVLRFLPVGAMLLIAATPYQLWAIFAGTYPAWQGHRAAILAMLLVLLAVSALRLLGTKPAKANVIVAIPVIAFLLHVFSIVVPAIVGGIALLAAAIDRRRSWENAALALSIMGAVIFASAFHPLVKFSTAERHLVDIEPGSEHSGVPDGLELTATPSIIHIVLDGYGAAGPLGEIYGHDTGPFFGELERRGFRVIDEAVTPYSQTLPAMASVMSGAPVDLAAHERRPGKLRADLAHTIRNGPVPALLEAFGYTFSRGESGYGFVDFADARNVMAGSLGMTSFEALLLRNFGAFSGTVHNNMLRDALAPGTLAELPQPFFHYQHLIAPHPPFSIAADGSARAHDFFGYIDGSHFISGNTELRADYIEGYREKARFIETALIDQIDAFPEGPMIVIIHGDHGPGAYLDHDNAERTCMRERMQTFVAVYSDVPGLTDRLLPPQGERFSIVNIYRAVFAALSGTDIPPLSLEAHHLQWDDPTVMTRATRADLDQPCGAVLTTSLDR